jgi:hypothetical protein
LVKPSVDLLFATLSSRPASRAASSGPAWNRAAAGDWGEVERVGDAAGWDSLTAEAASAGLRTVLRTAPLPPYLFTTSFTEAANESQLGGQDVRRRASAALQHGVAEGESLTLQPAVALRGAKPQTRDWHAIRLRKAIWLEAANGRPVAPAELDRRRAIQQRFEAGVVGGCGRGGRGWRLARAPRPAGAAAEPSTHTHTLTLPPSPPRRLRPASSCPRTAPTASCCACWWTAAWSWSPSPTSPRCRSALLLWVLTPLGARSVGLSSCCGCSRPWVLAPWVCLPAVGAHAPGCSLRGSVFLLWVLAPLGACTSPIPHLPRGPPSPR